MTSNRANYCTKTEDREIIQNQSGVSNPSWFKPWLVLTQVLYKINSKLKWTKINWISSNPSWFSHIRHLNSNHSSRRFSPLAVRVPYRAGEAKRKKHIFVVYDGHYMILNNIWLNIYIHFQSVMDMMKRFHYTNIRRFTAHFMIKIQRCNESMWIFSPQKLDFSILPWEWGAPGWAHLMIFDVWYVVFRF